MTQRTFIQFSILVVLPLAIGALIYIGWRSPTLLVFDWMAFFAIPADAFRPSFQLNSTILYSLPDGCWVFAGTAWMLLIWKRMHPWATVFMLLAICAEFGQYLQLVSGTFDWNDIFFYIAGFLLAWIGHNYVQTLFVRGGNYHHGGFSCR